MIYKIISTGSKGNAVLVGEGYKIMIDCGIPFFKIEPYYKELSLVLLTHEHGDHFNASTIRKLAQLRPSLRWACASWLVEKIIKCGVYKKQIDVVLCGELVNYKSEIFSELRICAKLTPHNVDNVAWHIFINHESVFYATDCSNLEHIIAKGYDLYLVEANYNENEIAERIRNKINENKYIYEYEVLKNHLSKEKADKWLCNNMGKHSEFEYLHMHIY
jgi:L-ascorbate metabolism protein UlaG (beta-lactamase superfamily)